MLNLLRRLLGLCIHEWHETDRQPIYGNFNQQKLPEAIRIEQRCSRCGRVRHVEETAPLA